MSPDQAFAELQRKSLETATGVVQLSIDNSKRMMDLQISTAKKLFDDGASSFKTMVESTDPQTAFSARSQYAQTAAERLADYSRQLLEISMEAQAELSHIVAEQMSTNSRDIIAATQQLFKSYPTVENPALATMQQTFATAQANLEKIVHMSMGGLKQTEETADPKAPGKKK